MLELGLTSRMRPACTPLMPVLRNRDMANFASSFAACVLYIALHHAAVPPRMLQLSPFGGYVLPDTAIPVRWHSNDAVVPLPDQPMPGTRTAMLRGLRGLCPCCGTSRL